MTAPLQRLAPALAALLMLASLAMPAAAQQTTQDSTALPEALRTARTAMSTALDKLDSAATAALFTTDGAVDFQGQVVTGREPVAGFFAEAFAGVSAVRFGPPTFIIADGQVTERASYVVAIPEGEQAGTSVTMWTRQEDGSWQVTRLTIT
jgi:hypothetical protein